MPRKGPAPKRPLVSDPVFGSPLVTQLVNKVLKDGKRSLASASCTPPSRAPATRPARTPSSR
jgi:ribosomal protein S7